MTCDWLALIIALLALYLVLDIRRRLINLERHVLRAETDYERERALSQRVVTRSRDGGDSSAQYAAPQPTG